MNIRVKRSKFYMVLTITILSSGQPVLANPASQISAQISRTVSQEVNKNISERMIEKTQKQEVINGDKIIFAKNDVKKAQLALQTLGFKPGVADGIMGKKTRKAIKLFQQSQKVNADGLLTLGLLVKLEQSQIH